LVTAVTVSPLLFSQHSSKQPQQKQYQPGMLRKSTYELIGIVLFDDDGFKFTRDAVLGIDSTNSAAVRFTQKGKPCKQSGRKLDHSILLDIDLTSIGEAKKHDVWVKLTSKGSETGELELNGQSINVEDSIKRTVVVAGDARGGWDSGVRTAATITVTVLEELEDDRVTSPQSQTASDQQCLQVSLMNLCASH
jgi:hypothetical protein